MKAERVAVVRRLSVVTLIGVAAAALAASPVLASAPTRAPGDAPRGLASSQMTLAQAPAGLQLAARSFEQTKLTAPDASPSQDFGTSVGIDGSTAVIGSSGGSGHVGAAYVFIRSGTTWAAQAKLTESSTPSADAFGSAVAISGSTVIVGALENNGTRGMAQVFTRSGTTWSRQATLIANDAALFNFFGASVAISGSTAVIGAYGFASFAGAAYVFVRSGTSWTQKKKLTASDGVHDDHFGEVVAIDGTTALVGAPAKNGNAGAAYVFVGSGTNWTQQAKLTASDGTQQDIFGSAVALHGANAVVGAPGFSPNHGAAYIYNRSGVTWTEQPKLTASDGAAGDRFGLSVAISDALAVVGADGQNGFIGAAYPFLHFGTGWSQQAKLTASDAACCDQFGSSAAISGTTAVVGAPSKSSATGAAYVEDLGLMAVQSPAGSPPSRSDGVNQSSAGVPGTRLPAAKRRVNRTITSTSEAVGSAEGGRQADGWFRFIQALLIR